MLTWHRENLERILGKMHCNTAQWHVQLSIDQFLAIFELSQTLARACNEFADATAKKCACLEVDEKRSRKNKRPSVLRKLLAVDVGPLILVKRMGRILRGGSPPR